MYKWNTNNTFGLSSQGIARTKKLQAEDLLELDPVHVKLCVGQDTIFVF